MDSALTSTAETPCFSANARPGAPEAAAGLQVFYHVAAIGDWRQVVAEQFSLITECGLKHGTVFTTFVGPVADLGWLVSEAVHGGIDLRILRTDENIMHYETFAIFEIERWARTAGAACALYFHTKGVSAPGHIGKIRWRHLMQDELIRNWRTHLVALQSYDAVGVNWRDRPFPRHFCGNFWMATARYLRTLPDFATYHESRRRVRTNCEFWIGSGDLPPKILSLVHHDIDYCSPEYFG